ncbi:LysR family transcriptional regulator [Novosphingobium nitrogenifigens DSM 19370]|uniref:LysR family transcriptional regulator n=2 Tax=Novosphingobium nitrogenifigens TaxID=378548 RepID=F1Z5J7_9SPHN|nr:LysR family transcriptional regulator [Novosphingobium nitrogenifigens DSM 19370]
MEMRNLRVLVEVIRQGGFTDAARVLFSTQSTVSKAIKALEDEMGVPLLERGSRHVAPTAAGAIVHRQALRILAAREDLLSEIAELKGLRRGLLRLGLPRVGGDALFAPIFARFRQRYPGIEVQLSEHGSARLRELLHSGELDLAGLLLPVSDEFETQELGREPVDALLPASHRLATRDSLRFSDLADTPLVLFDTGFMLHAMVTDAFRAHRLTPQVAAQSSQIGFMLELVAAGIGVSFLPRLVAHMHRREGVVQIPVGDPALEWRMALAWRREAYLPHAARAWLDVARAGA